MRSFRAFSLRSWVTAGSLALISFAPGCDDGVETNSDNVTDIKNSAVKNQSIGNCWVYATVGWAESLHLTHTGTELNLSESYVSYWHWFEEITGAKDQVKLGALSATGEMKKASRPVIQKIWRRVNPLVTIHERSARKALRSSSALM